MLSSRNPIAAGLLSLAMVAHEAHGGNPQLSGPVGSPDGDVTIVNEADDVILVSLGDKTRLGDVPAGGSRTFQKVRGGTQRIRALAAKADRSWETEVLVQFRPVPTWKVGGESDTGIKVLNYTKENLTVLLEREPWLKVPAGGSAVMYFVGAPPTRSMSVTSDSGKFQYPARLMTITRGQLREWKIGTAPSKD